MRKGILAIAAAGSMFALVSAGAATVLDLGSSQAGSLAATGSATFVMGQCTDTFSITYTRSGADVTKVEATDTLAAGSVPANCQTAGTTWQFDSDTAVTGSYSLGVWTFDYSGAAKTMSTGTHTSTMTIPAS